MKRTRTERLDPLTIEETNLFLKTVKEHFAKDHPLFLLLLRTGMRIGAGTCIEVGGY